MFHQHILLTSFIKSKERYVLIELLSKDLLNIFTYIICKRIVCALLILADIYFLLASNGIKMSNNFNIFV